MSAFLPRGDLLHAQFPGVANKKWTGRRIRTPSKEPEIETCSPSPPGRLVLFGRLVLLCRFLLLGWPVLFLMFLLLFLLEFLLLLIVFLLKLLQLLLLFLFELLSPLISLLLSWVWLRRSLVWLRRSLIGLRLLLLLPLLGVSIFLFELLALLRLLLLDSLALLILFRTHVLELFLVLLLELRIDSFSRTRSRRPVVVASGIAAAPVCRSIVWLVRLLIDLGRLIRRVWRILLIWICHLRRPIWVALGHRLLIWVGNLRWPIRITRLRVWPVVLRVLWHTLLRGRRDLNVRVCIRARVGGSFLLRLSQL